MPKPGPLNPAATTTPGNASTGENTGTASGVESIHPAQMRAAQVRAVQVRAAQVRAAQVRAAQVRAAQVRAAQVRAAQVRAAQVRAAQMRAAQVRAGTVGTQERGAVNQGNNVRATKTHLFLVGTEEVLGGVIGHEQERYCGNPGRRHTPPGLTRAHPVALATRDG